MHRSRLLASRIFAAGFVLTTAALAGDRASTPPPSNAAAEQTLKRARDALAKIDRLEIDCRWSDLDNQHETEVRYQTHFYLQNPVGYLFEIRPLTVAGKVSRGRTKSGQAFRLKSRRAETTLFASGLLTEIDDGNRTYQVTRCEPQPGNPLPDIDQPRYFSGIVIPHPLHWANDWNVLRANYRIEQFATTATTIGIALTAKSQESWDDLVKRGIAVVGNAPPDATLRSPAFWKELQGDYAVAPSRDEIILDRQTLLPKSWRRIYGPSDSLITYERFDVNPAPRALAVSLSGYRQALLPVGHYTFTVTNVDPAGKATAEPTWVMLDSDELDAQLLLLETGYSLVRLVGLF